MIKILKGLTKLFEKPKQVSLFDQAELDLKFKTIKILQTKPSKDFYNDLIILFTKNVIDPNNSNHKKFFKEFCGIIYEQSDYFGEIIESNFNRKHIDNFFVKFEEVYQMNFEFPFTKMLNTVYWFQIVKKLNQEALSQDKVELSVESERLLNMIEKKSHEINN